MSSSSSPQLPDNKLWDFSVAFCRFAVFFSVICISEMLADITELHLVATFLWERKKRVEKNQPSLSTGVKSVYKATGKQTSTYQLWNKKQPLSIKVHHPLLCHCSAAACVSVKTLLSTILVAFQHRVFSLTNKKRKRTENHCSLELKAVLYACFHYNWAPRSQISNHL